MKVTTFTVATMLKELDLFDDRYRVAGDVIGQRKGLKDMDPEELKQIYMHCISEGASPVTDTLTPEDRQRRKIISLFRTIGFEKDGKADLTRIKKYIKEVGFAKKGLYEYSALELPKLVTQIELIVNKEIASFRKQQ